MRSMPRRLNSEMRALIPFKLNTTWKKGKIMMKEMRGAKIMRRMPRRLNSEMRALIPFTMNNEHHLEKKGKIIILEMRDVMLIFCLCTEYRIV